MCAYSFGVFRGSHYEVEFRGVGVKMILFAINTMDAVRKTIKDFDLSLKWFP